MTKLNTCPMAMTWAHATTVHKLPWMANRTSHTRGPAMEAMCVHVLLHELTGEFSHWCGISKQSLQCHIGHALGGNPQCQGWHQTECMCMPHKGQQHDTNGKGMHSAGSLQHGIVTSCVGHPTCQQGGNQIGQSHNTRDKAHQCSVIVMQHAHTF